MDKSTIFIGSNDYFVPQYDVFPCVHRGVVLALFYLSRDRRALTSARYPMFPHQEKVITWDEFGLTVQGEEVRDPYLPHLASHSTRSNSVVSLHTRLRWCLTHTIP